MVSYTYLCVYIYAYKAGWLPVAPPSRRIVREGAKSYVQQVTAPVSLSKHCGSGGEDLLALLAQLALGPDVPVVRRPSSTISPRIGSRGCMVSHKMLGSYSQQATC